MISPKIKGRKERKRAWLAATKPILRGSSAAEQHVLRLHKCTSAKYIEARRKAKLKQLNL
jgi:hypothetical protein